MKLRVLLFCMIIVAIGCKPKRKENNQTSNSSAQVTDKDSNDQLIDLEYSFPIPLKEIEKDTGKLRIEKIKVKDDSPYTKYRDKQGFVTFGHPEAQGLNLDVGDLAKSVHKATSTATPPKKPKTSSLKLPDAKGVPGKFGKILPGAPSLRRTQSASSLPTATLGAGSRNLRQFKSAPLPESNLLSSPIPIVSTSGKGKISKTRYILYGLGGLAGAGLVVGVTVWATTPPDSDDKDEDSTPPSDSDEEVKIKHLIAADPDLEPYLCPSKTIALQSQAELNKIGWYATNNLHGKDSQYLSKLTSTIHTSYSTTESSSSIQCTYIFTDPHVLTGGHPTNYSKYLRKTAPFALTIVNANYNLLCDRERESHPWTSETRVQHYINSLNTYNCQAPLVSSPYINQLSVDSQIRLTRVFRTKEENFIATTDQQKKYLCPPVELAQDATIGSLYQWHPYDWKVPPTSTPFVPDPNLEYGIESRAVWKYNKTTNQTTTTCKWNFHHSTLAGSKKFTKRFTGKLHFNLYNGECNDPDATSEVELHLDTGKIQCRDAVGRTLKLDHSHIWDLDAITINDIGDSTDDSTGGSTDGSTDDPIEVIDPSVFKTAKVHANDIAREAYLCPSKQIVYEDNKKGEISSNWRIKTSTADTRTPSELEGINAIIFEFITEETYSNATNITCKYTFKSDGDDLEVEYDQHVEYDFTYKDSRNMKLCPQTSSETTTHFFEEDESGEKFMYHCSTIDTGSTLASTPKLVQDPTLDDSEYFWLNNPDLSAETWYTASEADNDLLCPQYDEFTSLLPSKNLYSELEANYKEWTWVRPGQGHGGVKIKNSKDSVLLSCYYNRYHITMKKTIENKNIQVLHPRTKTEICSDFTLNPLSPRESNTPTKLKLKLKTTLPNWNISFIMATRNKFHGFAQSLTSTGLYKEITSTTPSEKKELQINSNLESKIVATGHYKTVSCFNEFSGNFDSAVRLQIATSEAPFLKLVDAPGELAPPYKSGFYRVD